MVVEESKLGRGGGGKGMELYYAYIGALCNWTAVCKVFRFLAVFTQACFPLKYYRLHIPCCGWIVGGR